MGKIVAIGGGEIKNQETMLIDKFIVEFSGVLKPKLLFIPTASSDSETYIETINNVFGELLGCDVDELLLINSNISQVEIQEKILSSDIIYVGGGDTAKMLKIWRHNNVDTYLKEAYEKNIVLSGLSAGSICWFEKGLSCYSINHFVKDNGLGLIKAINCPHYNEKTGKCFDNIMKTETLPMIAVENNCAFVVKDDMYKTITSANNKAYLMRKNEEFISELSTNRFSKLSKIL